jgi:hypothetical protein
MIATEKGFEKSKFVIVIMEVKISVIKDLLTECGFDLTILRSFSSSVTLLYNLMIFVVGIPQVSIV